MSDVANARGIYCLETVWYATTSNRSMRPMLELMHACHGTPYVHRNAVSRDEFFYFLEAWLDDSNDDGDQYPTLILSYHGVQGAVILRDDEDIDWDDEDAVAEFLVPLEEVADRVYGRCKNRVIHFASCSTVNVNTNEIADFIQSSGVSAVSGYTEDVDWMDSMAFELLYMEAVQTAKFKYLTPERLWEVNDGLKKAPYTELGESLGFNMRIRSQPARN